MLTVLRWLFNEGRPAAAPRHHSPISPVSPPDTGRRILAL
jgi:hypothetical protein